MLMKNQLMNNAYYRNIMKQNYLYYQANYSSMNMNQINFQLNPQLFYNNYNINNYQSQLFFNKNTFSEFSQSKYSFINSKSFILKSKLPKIIPNILNNEKDEYIHLKKRETSFTNNEEKNRHTKKDSIDTTYSNQSFNDSSLSSEEQNQMEKNEENPNNLKEDETDIDPENEKCNKKGRRYSNKSKTSNCSKTSQSTDISSKSFYNEKDKNKNCNNICDLKENEKKEEKYIGNPAFENTVILNVNVKISKDRTAIFKLKRFDDLFLTIKLFCEINSVDEKLIKPLIIKSLSTLNTIYQIMNSKLDEHQINTLKEIKNN